MAKIIKVTGPTQKLIKVIGPTQKLVKPDVVAKALGAEKVGIKIDTKQGPISLFSLRQFFIGRLRSTGGRPALAGTVKKRNKIPLFPEDWIKLKKMSEYFKRKDGINVSPGQIASALIHRDISKTLFFK
ncbi:MAG: hypothetical protein L6420_06900 [Elusimicrobia bacterium]|nr:hypothetical protein [Candidatus Omnitrophota bacterium]MCG2725969.1 hypothetical protein [Elusimicrobiota bacterium]